MARFMLYPAMGAFMPPDTILITLVMLAVLVFAVLMAGRLTIGPGPGPGRRYHRTAMPGIRVRSGAALQGVAMPMRWGVRDPATWRY